MSLNFYTTTSGCCQRSSRKQKWIDAIFLDEECGMPGAVNGRFQQMKLSGGKVAVLAWCCILA